MKLVTFDPFRTLGCPGVQYLKADQINRQLDVLNTADWILFPEYADVNLLVHGLGRRIFPSLPSYTLGFDKVEMTRAFQLRFPQHVPETLIYPNSPYFRDLVPEQLLYPFVAKLPRSSSGDGVFLVENREDWQRYCNLTDILYAQEKLEIDRDLRVVWIGDRVVHAYWRVAAPGSFHNNVAHGGHIQCNDIPAKALELVRLIAGTLAIDHAGFDIAMVGDWPYVFEFNRLFGLEGLNRADIQTGRCVHEYLLRRESTALSHAGTVDAA